VTPERGRGGWTTAERGDAIFHEWWGFRCWLGEDHTRSTHVSLGGVVEKFELGVMGSNANEEDCPLFYNT